MKFRFSLLLFPLLVLQSFSTSIIYKNVNDVTGEAKLIVVGQVTDVWSFWTPDHSMIRTSITVEVSSVLKGFAPSRITFTQNGGTVGDTTLYADRFPHYISGQRVVLFLTENLQEMCPTVGMDQGAFVIVRDPSSGKDVVYTMEGERVLGLSSIGDAITDTPFQNSRGELRILGGTALTKKVDAHKPLIHFPIDAASDFLRYITSRIGRSSEIIEIPEPQVVPPRNGKNGATIQSQNGKFIPHYQLNKYWSTAKCTIMYSPSQYPDGSTQYTRMKDAATAWNFLAGSRFQFIENTTRSEKSAPNADGTNYITRGPLTGGTLGVTYYWIMGDQLTEIDLIMSTSVSWTYTNPSTCSTGSPYDFWNVGVHEFGHAWGLNHESSMPATLNPYYPGGWSGNWNHDVMADDRNAIRVQYSSSSPVPTEFFTTRWKLNTPGVVTWVSNTPSSATVGSTVTVEYSLHTQGLTVPCKPLRVGFYLSTDATITSADVLMGVTYFAPADTFTTGTYTTTLSVPTVTAGTYYIGWYIDDLNLYSESDETNNGTARCATITIGTGTAAVKDISTNPASTLNFGSQALNTTSNAQNITITNSASSTRSIKGYAYLDCPVTDFEIISGDGSFTLAPGQSQVVSITFKPTQCGARTAILHIDHEGTNVSSPKNITLTGNGACADIEWVSTDVQFGKVDTGVIATETFVFKNSASSVQAISGSVAISQSALGQYTIVSGGGAFSLPPNQTKTVTVQYKPTTCGDAVGEITVTHNALNEPSPKTFPISGFGACRVISVVPLSLNFGNVEVGMQTQYESIMVTNQPSSNDSLTIVVGCPLVGGGADDFKINPASCGTHKIAPGEEFEMQALFKPQGEGLRLVNADIQHNSTVKSIAKPFFVELRGNGTVIPKVARISIMNSMSLGIVKVGRDTTVTLTYTNTGNATLSIHDITLEGQNAAEFTVTPADSATLPQAQLGNFTIKFKPTEVGLRASTLKFTTNDPDKPQVNVSLTGTGQAPKISVSTQQIDFGQMTIGSNATKQLILTNDGNFPLQINSLTLGGSDATNFSLQPAPPYTIDAGQSLTINFTFNATATGVKNATATIISDGGSPIIVHLLGEGIPQPIAKISLSTTTLDFGSILVNTTASKQLEISNTGTANLTVTGASITNVAPSDFSVSFSSPITLQPGQKQSIDVDFKPTSVGQSTATLNVMSNDLQNPSLPVLLKGSATAIPKAQIILRTTALDFGTIVLPANAKKFLSLENQGNATLVVSNVQLNMTGQSEFTYAFPQPLSILPGKVDSIEITFAPLSVGTKTAELEITHNDPDKGVLKVLLTGNAIAAGKLTASATVLDFGTIDVKEPIRKRSFILQNIGGVAVTISKQNILISPPHDFLIDRTATSLLNPGASDSVVLGLQPNIARLGPQSAKFQLESDAPSTPLIEVTLQGNVVNSTDVTRSSHPARNFLHQNYPNPISSNSGHATEIQYELSTRSQVVIHVMNIFGQTALAPITRVQEAGVYSLRIDVSSLSAGVYFYRMIADDFSAVKTLTIVK